MVFTERLRELISGEKGRKLLIAGAASALLLLLLGTFSCGGGKKPAVLEKTECAAEIEQALEQRLERLISQIDGAGSATVMVTLDTVSERIYEKDKKSESASQSTAQGSSASKGSETEVVLAGSAKEPLQIGTVQPKVRGAAVVCSGASDPAVREKVTKAVAKALNIGISQVYVTY